MLDRSGNLILAGGDGKQLVLDHQQKPIRLDPTTAPELSIGEDGQISYRGTPLARVGLFDVPNPQSLTKRGGTLLAYPDPNKLTTAAGTVRSQFLERANVDPTLELTQLMEAQRQLEANANMIRYQDQTLGRLVNDVGKIT